MSHRDDVPFEGDIRFLGDIPRLVSAPKGEFCTGRRTKPAVRETRGGSGRVRGWRMLAGSSIAGDLITITIGPTVPWTTKGRFWAQLFSLPLQGEDRRSLRCFFGTCIPSSRHSRSTRLWLTCVVDLPTTLAKCGVNSWAAKTRSPPGDPPHLFQQTGFVPATTPCVTLRAAALPQHTAHPPLRNSFRPQAATHFDRRASPPLGAHQFPLAASFNISMSNA